MVSEDFFLKLSFTYTLTYEYVLRNVQVQTHTRIMNYIPDR